MQIRFDPGSMPLEQLATVWDFVTLKAGVAKMQRRFLTHAKAPDPRSPVAMNVGVYMIPDDNSVDRTAQDRW
jgi:hypothetical protein